MDERVRLQIIENAHNARRCLVCQNIPELHRAEINYYRRTMRLGTHTNRN